MQILGIHLDDFFCRTCLLSKSGNKVEILLLKTDPPNVKSLYNTKSAAVLPASACMVRNIALNTTGGKHLDKAALFKAEANSHLDPSETMHIPLLRKREGKTEALLFTFSKEEMKRYLNKFSTSPDLISAIPSALAHFYRWKTQEKTLFSVDLGSYETTYTWIEKGNLKKSHHIPLGVETLLEALFQDRKKVLLKEEVAPAAKQIDLLLLKQGFNPNLTLALNDLRNESSKIYYSLFQEEKIPVFVTGRTDALIHLKEYLFSDAESLLSQDEELYAVSIGTALEAVSSQPLQLCQGEFFPKKNWRKLGLFASLLLSLSLLLSGAILCFTAHFIRERTEEMKSSFQIKGDLAKWIFSVEKESRPFPYILQAPKASEALHLISSHPLIKSISLQNIHYRLVSYPTFLSLKEPYAAKVELEFQSKSAMDARKFHDALRENTPWVDTSKEIHWETLSDGYRVGFFFKNERKNV